MKTGDNKMSNNEDLIERQLMPNIDLLDANKNILTDGSWKQTHTADNVEELVYGGIRDGESKTITINGIMADVEAGQELWTNSVKFATASSVIDIIDIQTLALGYSTARQMVRIEPPILYDKNETLKIYFNTKTGATGKTDKVILVGTVLEPRGNYIG